MTKDVLAEFNKKINSLEEKLRSSERQVHQNVVNFYGNKPKFVIFVSISDATSRAKVFVGSGNSIDTSWKNAVDKCRKYIKQTNYEVFWVKVDLVKEVKEYTLEEFLKYSSTIRKHYFREGISFDIDFNTAFLEQEVNANVFIKRENGSVQDQLHISNINYYLKHGRDSKYELNLSSIRKIYLFSTLAYFYDDDCFELYNDGLSTGRRKIDKLTKDFVYDIIDSASNYLASQVEDNGRFTYGYFPCFDKKIDWYNMLRHASTLYSMIESYELTKNEILETSIKRAIRYLIKEGIVIFKNRNGNSEAFVIEKTSGNEIKLGANAAAILALSKYTKVFNDNQFNEIMTMLAHGIRRFQDKQSGEFVHVLNYPDLSVKERHRIVYYDGEAAFALMRLYEIDQNSLWLETVEKAFENFIKRDYWKHHDHWLGYCVNELTKYRPIKQYFEFGLKNIEGKLDFILHRDTTYPTFLELLMAAYSMIKRIENDNDLNSLLIGFDKEKLVEIINFRANHQLNGFFFPEVAMYFKSPYSILGAFYIRHHAFRARIDDIEHNLSGYYNFYKVFLERKPEDVRSDDCLDRLNKSDDSICLDENISEELVEETAVTTSNPLKLSDKAWTYDNLTQVLGGSWYHPPQENWGAYDIAINREGCGEPGTLFIAIDEERWHSGSGNTGVYAGWTDTHTLLPSFQEKVIGAIVERPIELLDKSIPQLVVEDSYQAIKVLGKAARQAMSGKVVAVTGTVGKSSTRKMISHLLENFGTVVSTRGNHNTRTGVPLTLARCINNPDFCVLEVAISALWMRSGGICKFARPHIGVITEIGLGQVGTVSDVRSTAIMKARICEGIEPGGVAILNHDMQEFDLVKSEVEKHGATPLTYGFNVEADIHVIEWKPTVDGSLVRANIRGTEVEYSLPLPGRGMISNSLAALATVYALGLDPVTITSELSTIPLKESVLETISIDLPNGKVHILDDSYNAEILSMISAFEVAKIQASPYNGRKIAVLGRIVNLGKKTEDLHRSLARPLIDAGFDKVFAHGEEMRFLLEELPQNMIGGLFTDARSCAFAVSNSLVSDDYVLLKGSRRGSDFGKIRSYLIEALKERSTSLNSVQSKVLLDNNKEENPTYGGVLLDFESGEILLSIGDPEMSAPEGLGQALLLSLAFNKISKGEISLTEDILVKNSAVVTNSVRSLGLKSGDIIDVHNAISAVICNNAPDAALVLAERMGGGSSFSALTEMHLLATKLGIRGEAVRNVTGREKLSHPQQFNTIDLAKAAKHLFSNIPPQKRLLSCSSMVYKGKHIVSPSSLVSSGEVPFGFFFGRNHGHGLTLSRVGGRDVIACVCGARDEFHRDYLIMKMLAKLSRSEISSIQHEKNSTQQLLTDVSDEYFCINLLGDTYFGESYTRKRKEKGRQDALSLHGYDYSFAKLNKLLESGHINIANLEAALTENTSSPFDGVKPFVLVGDPSETTKALKRHAIHAVSLGNNHTMDFGGVGLNDTLKALDSAEIARFGAGRNIDEAEEPLRLCVRGKNIIFFSAYWYRRYMQQSFQYYAMGNRPGVSCLGGDLLERIHQEKTKDPEAFVIVLPHWGQDFVFTTPLQRKYANQLIESGADLILGHGAHMMQEIENISGKWVVYGLGNGVFNSDGEYVRRNKPPYSFIAQILIGKERHLLKLYPIFTNNLDTFWQPYPVDEYQFEHVLKVLKSLGTMVGEGLPLVPDVDKFGYHISIEIR
ncbi:CapA family protein [Brevibacillus panacihumi]|uniref:CapA family protein n=1 Tax=Brevibacillus panacihumi TaxID=497735 RepID=UPI003D1F8309